MVYNSAVRAVQLVGGLVITSWPVNGPFTYGYARDCWFLEGSYYSGWPAVGPHWVPCGNVTGPGARAFGGMAFDAADNETLLFGGVGPAGQLGDTWTYSAGAWTQINTGPGGAPSPRSNFTMVYDSADGEVVLSGGSTILTGGPPRPGGTPKPAGPAGSPGTSVILHNDTWTFSHGVWTNVTNMVSNPHFGGLSLGYRAGQAEVYDGIDAYTLAFGGIECFQVMLEPCQFNYTANQQALRDTSTFAKASTSNAFPVWNERGPFPAPSPRYGASMAYDSNDGEVILFGGVQCWCMGSDGVPINTLASDTWTYSAGGWSEVYPANSTSPTGWRNIASATLPSDRNSSATSHDPGGGYSILFGGHNGAHIFNDTWSYVAGHWLNLSKTLSRAPSIRYGAAMAYDSADGYIVLFGGSSSITNPRGSLLGDTWLFSNGEWTKANSLLSPAARYGASMTYDAQLREVILFGGVVANSPPPPSPYACDTWGFVAGAWTLLVPCSGTHPVGRANASFAFDPTNQTNRSQGYDVLFGGYSSSPSTYYRDTWEYSSRGWTNVTSTGGPVGRASAGFATDGTDGYLVLFGGEGASSNLSDTWKFSSSTWTRLTESISPPPRFQWSCTFDQRDRLVLLFGGGPNHDETWGFWNNAWLNISPRGLTTAENSTAAAYNGPGRGVLSEGGAEAGNASGPKYPQSTWEFVQGHGTDLTPGLRSAPPGTQSASLAYDERDGYVLFFGGFNLTWVCPHPNDCTFYPHFLNETWIFQYGTWTQLGIPNSPIGRDGAGMAYDPVDGYTVLFGGMDSIGIYLNDTWTFTGTSGGGVWSEILPIKGPSGTYQGAMAFDSATGSVILYGGSNSTENQPMDGSNVTWNFSGGMWTKVRGPDLNTTKDWTRAESMAYVPDRQAIIVYGGVCWDNVAGVQCGQYGGGAANWTWELTLVPYNGRLVYHWSNISSQLKLNPGGTFTAAMSVDFDTVSGIMIGGYTNSRSSAVWEIG